MSSGSSAARFDCNDDESGWSDVKKAWCSAHAFKHASVLDSGTEGTVVDSVSTEKTEAKAEDSEVVDVAAKAASKALAARAAKKGGKKTKKAADSDDEATKALLARAMKIGAKKVALAAATVVESGPLPQVPKAAKKKAPSQKKEGALARAMREMASMTAA